MIKVLDLPIGTAENPMILDLVKIASITLMMDYGMICHVQIQLNRTFVRKDLNGLLWEERII